MEVKVGSGVGVSGAGVEVGSPAGTVCVGTAVSVMVGVDWIITDVPGGTGVRWGINWLAKRERRATVTVPQTPINAAMIVGSILELDGPDIFVPIL